MYRKITAGIGLLLLTMAYCRLTWLGFGLYKIILPVDVSEFPLVTRLAAFQALPWQLLAVLSFALNISWLFRNNDRSENQRNAALPLVCHTGWIVFSLCCHGIGMLAPYISYASVLSS